MGRVITFIYGLICYLAFFGTILYAIGFIENMVVPKGIDDGTVGSAGQSILINVLLLGAFALQHSIMARPAFKVWWTKIIPKQIERSTYVLLSSGLLCLMFWQWRPMTTALWSIDQPILKHGLHGISFLGWAMVFYSTFIINHFDLFGLRQVFLYLQGKPYTDLKYAERSLYKLVRHPLYLGFITAFWFTPDMTQGHLLFAAVTTAYILVAIQLEERDLMKGLGQDYIDYRKRVSMILPIPKGKGTA
ncbi:MAG: isoprenylcysteine carboxylmethyltransferase family protein [Planctomycetes bacterium]|nr:isoprenylcysteine carboxylmethyltransferase family protein [Planctomycetota bacterium]MCH8258951.1 isoprenylcysteine carboxylmethyltransferase family protein [Planctomycetota bacterium]